VDKIRVVLADDHPEMAASVRAALGDDFEIVAAVENGGLAMDAVVALDPDVLITDISMPVLDGLQVARRLRESNCRAKVIFLTMHNDSYFISAALAAGVVGYVTKTLLSSDLLHAIEDALKGNTFISGPKPY
jgi:DNA-binding NarL/FixJ family response regulator